MAVIVERHGPNGLSIEKINVWQRRKPQPSEVQSTTPLTATRSTPVSQPAMQASIRPKLAIRRRKA